MPVDPVYEKIELLQSGLALLTLLCVTPAGAYLTTLVYAPRITKEERRLKGEKDQLLRWSHHRHVRCHTTNGVSQRPVCLSQDLLEFPSTRVRQSFAGCRVSGDFTDSTASPKVPFPSLSWLARGHHGRGVDWLPLAWKSSGSPGCWCRFQGPFQRVQANPSLLSLVNARSRDPSFPFTLAVPPRLNLHR